MEEQAEVAATAYEIQAQMLANLSEELESYVEAATDMFNRLSEESKLTIDEMTENLEHNQRVVEEWADNIAILAERGIDEGLLQTLRDAGPEAAGTVAELVAATDEQLEKLSDTFANGSDVATQALITAFGLPEVTGSGAEMVDEIAAGVEESDRLDQASQDLIDRSKDIVTAAVEDNNFPEVGENIVEGMETGVEEKTPELLETMEDMADQVEDTVRDAFETHSPSVVFAEIGGDLIDGLVQGIEDKAQEVYESIKAIVDNVKESLSQVAPESNDLDKWISDLDSTASAGVPKVIDGIVKLFSELPKKVYEAALPTKEKVNEVFTATNTVGTDKSKQFVESVVKIFTELPNKIYSAILPTKDRVTEWGNTLISIGTEKSNTFVDTVVRIMSELPNKIQTAIDPAKERVTTWGNQMTEIGKTKSTEFVDAVITIVRELPNKYYDAIKPAIDKVQEWANNLVSKARSEMPRFVAATTEEAQKVVPAMQTVGVQMVEGFWAGIDSKTGWFYNNLKSFIDEIVRRIKRDLDINSPSRVMAEIGEFTAEGFIVGLLSMAAAVEKAIDNVFDPDLLLTPEFADLSGLAGARLAAAGGAGGGKGDMIFNQHFYAAEQSPYEMETAARAAFNTARW